MRHVQRWIDTESEQAAEDRRTASIAGLAFALFLVVIGLSLISHLRRSTGLEDCLLSGRTDCGPVLVRLPARTF